MFFLIVKYAFFKVLKKLKTKLACFCLKKMDKDEKKEIKFQKSADIALYFQARD